MSLIPNILVGLEKRGSFYCLNFISLKRKIVAMLKKMYIKHYNFTSRYVETCQNLSRYKMLSKHCEIQVRTY